MILGDTFYERLPLLTAKFSMTRQDIVCSVTAFQQSKLLWVMLSDIFWVYGVTWELIGLSLIVTAWKPGPRKNCFLEQSSSEASSLLHLCFFTQAVNCNPCGT